MMSTPSDPGRGDRSANDMHDPSLDRLHRIPALSSRETLIVETISGAAGRRAEFGGSVANEADEAAQRRALVHNEQAKIRATLMNTVAAGLLVAGIVTPLASAALIGVAISGPLVALMGIWFVAALILHYGALLALETMK